MQKHGAASCIIREISDKLGKPKELVAVFFMETTGDMAFSGSMGGAVCPTAFRSAPVHASVARRGGPPRVSRCSSSSRP